jgi:hypothetical protein
MKERLEFKKYKKVTEMRPIGEQAGYQLLFLGTGLFVAIMVGFIYWSTILFLVIILALFLGITIVSLINWITERDEYLEEVKND